MKPVCITFAGPIGAGKSPVAHYLSWNLGIGIFANDQVRYEVMGNALAYEANGSTYLAERDRQLDIVFTNGRDVILDASVDRSWPRVEKLLVRHGYEHFIISFDLGEDHLTKLLDAKRKSHSDIALNMADHQKFLDTWPVEVGLVIDDFNYANRNAVALEAVRSWLVSLGRSA